MLIEVATVGLGPAAGLVDYEVVQVEHEVLLYEALLLDTDLGQLHENAT